MNVPMRFAAAAMLLVLLGAGSCAPTTIEATATEAELCRQWRDSLPTRSRQDTEGTKADIGTAYDVQAALCAPLGLARF